VRLSLLELQILVALDDDKTLSQIARELYLKHPTISRALHSAERKTGVPLAEHVGRRLRLTSGGVELATHARNMLARYDDLDRMMEDLRDGQAGTVHVLATRTASSYLLPRSIHRFVTAFIHANISLQVATPGEVWQRFREERHDVAVAPRTHDTPGDADWLFDDQDKLYVNPSSALLNTAPGAPVHLPTLIAPIAQEPERHVDEHLRRRDVSFGRRLDIRSLEAAKQLVEAGVGAGLFGESTVTRELAEGRLAELSGLHLELSTAWYVAVRLGRRRSPLVDSLVVLLSEDAASWRAAAQRAP
jgi:DNA-binding transcriptional LysR family regulator